MALFNDIGNQIPPIDDTEKVIGLEETFDTNPTVANIDIEQQFPNNPQIGDVIDKSMIQQSNLPGYEEDIIARNRTLSQPVPTGAQNVNDLYPGLSQNIAQGNYSGSIVGSNTIYTPAGNILALNPILERRKAQDAAARARLEQLKPITPPTPYQLKDARFQQRLANKFNSEVRNMIDEDYKRYGQEANMLYRDPSSPQYRKLKDLEEAYNIYGKNFDQLTTALSTMELEMKENKFLYPEEAKKQLRDYQTMQGRVFGEEGGFENIGELNRMRNELMSFPTIANWMKENIQFDKINGDITSRFIVGNGGELLTHKTITKENFDAVKKQIVAEAERSMWPQIENGTVTPKQIEDYVDGMLRNSEKVTSAGVSQKREDSIDRSKVETPTVFDPTKPNIQKISTFNQDGTVVSGKEAEYKEYFYAPVSKAKEVVLDSPMRINGSNMRDRVSGQVNFTPQAFAVVRNDDGKDSKVVYGTAKVPTEVYVSPDGKTVLSKEQYTSLSDLTKSKDGKTPVREPGVQYKTDFKPQVVLQQQDMTVVWSEDIHGKIKQSVNSSAADRVYKQAEEVKMSTRDKKSDDKPKTETPKSSSIPTIKTQAEFDRLKSGQEYIEDGVRYRKP